MAKYALQERPLSELLKRMNPRAIQCSFDKFQMRATGGRCQNLLSYWVCEILKNFCTNLLNNIA